jgi:FlaA1/EpsC-like NDP-sugar epimerase
LSVVKWIKKQRTLLIAFLDILLVGGIYFFCTVVLNNEAWKLSIGNRVLSSVIPAIVYVLFLLAFQVYGSLWKYAEVDEFFFCAIGSLTAGLTYAVAYHPIVGLVPLLNHVLAAFTTTLILVLYRSVYSILSKSHINWHYKAKKRLMIVGAGMAAASLISEIRKNKSDRYLPVCLVDDNPDKLGRFINGLKIRGNIEDIPRLCKELSVDIIFICIPSATASQRRRILDYCSKTSASIKILPEVFDAITNPGRLQQKLRAIQIEDLIGRQEKSFNGVAINGFIRDKVVLITGGGGSIGSELCRQVAYLSPKKLIILDIFEGNAYAIQMELMADFKDLDLAVEIATIRDPEKMDDIFAKYRPDVVFHAAAHKHVPLMEHNPEEALKNNVFGTINVVNAANKYKASKFVLISSDKAVNPTNFMGATKRLAEMIIQSRRESETHFVAVRFGNVLGSSGSVVPLFEKQIERGGPVTVTHPEITRFFMTIPEAVQLVLQAAVMAKNGEIYVLDMGEPVRILSLAEQMIRLSGLRPYEDIDIVFTGLRPGEKLYEELMMNEEGLKSTQNSRIFIGYQTPISLQEVEQKCAKLQAALEKKDKNHLLRVMQEVVPTYCPDIAPECSANDAAHVKVANE